MIIRVSGSSVASSVNLIVTGSGVPGTAAIRVNVPQFVSYANQAESAYNATSASFADFAMSSSFVLTASYALTSAGTITNAVSSSYAFSASTADSLTFVPSTASYAGTDWNAINNKPTVVSSSTQLPSGILSGSTQINLLTNVSASWASRSLTTTSASYAPTILPSGAVSSSAQAAEWSVASASVATSASYAPTILPIGSVSSSAQAAGWSVASSSVATSASYALTASYALNGGGGTGLFASSSVSSSWASQSLSSSFASTASAATSLTFMPLTASYALTAGATGGGVTGQGATNKVTKWATVSTITTSSITDDGVSVSMTVPLSASAFTGSGVGIIGVVTSSYALTASYASNAGITNFSTGSYTGSFTGSLLGSASYAGTTWNAINNKPVGLVSSSAQLPTGLVSSSAQISTGSFTGSFTGSLLGSASYALTSSAATSITFVPPTASYAGTDWNAINNKPTVFSSSAQLPAGTVSSSQQINTGSFTGSFTGSLLGSASYALSSSYVDSSAFNSLILPLEFTFSTSTTAADPGRGSFRYNSAVTSSITQIYIDQLTNGGLDISTIISNWKSGSHQLYIQQKDDSTKASAFDINGVIVDNSGWFTIPVLYRTSADLGVPQNNKVCAFVVINNTIIVTGQTYAVTASWANNATSASYAGTDWNAINNKPSVVSSSAQINTGSYTGSFTGAFAGPLTGTASYAISSSFATSTIIIRAGTFETGTVLPPDLFTTGSYTGSLVGNLYGTASYAVSSSYASVAQTLLGTIESASYALTASYAFAAVGSADWSAVTNKPAGLVSSSAQVNTGSFTGSFTGNLAGSASYALSASWAPGAGAVSASYATTSATASYVSGGVVIIGLPTDGAYGGTAGNVSGLATGDLVENAFDKIETILGKLAPAKPGDLSTRTLALASTYTALEAVTGTSRSTITTSTQPTSSWTFSVATSGSTSTLSYDADAGTLSAEFDSGVSAGSAHVMTTASDTGSYENLIIKQDADPYNGTFGQQGFWKGFIAQTAPTSALSLGAHTTRLIHSTTGATPLYTFYIDNPRTPSAVSMSLSTGSYTGRYISGVPSLATGDTVLVYFTGSNAVSQFYNSTRINAGSSTVANTVNQGLPANAPASGAFVSASITLTVLTAQYTETSSYTGTTYNSQGTTGTSTITASLGTTRLIRVDTTSTEARVFSGIGQYPAIGAYPSGAGLGWVATESLLNNKELQVLNGTYQYPPARTYQRNYPVVGPNYTGSTADPFESHRWATFTQSVSAVSAVTVAFNGASNFVGIATSGSMRVYARVDGASPTVGWVDGATAYGGTGDPTNDGDPALVIGSSTTTSKRITFGTAAKTGVLYVRVGIPSTSTRTFTSVTIT